MNESKLLQAWNQTQTAVLFRPAEGNLLVRMPYGDGTNRVYLAKGRAKRPTWNLKFKCWELPRSAFNEVAQRLLGRFPKLFIIQPYNPDQKCCAACQHAKGLDCECSCMGKHHGLGGTPWSAWFAQTDAFRGDFKGRPYQIQTVIPPTQAMKDQAALAKAQDAWEGRIDSLASAREEEMAHGRDS